jgi:hypothetical protein
MSEYKVWQDSGQMPFEQIGNPHHRVKMLEKYLFTIKRLARQTPVVHGKVIISAQSPYRCVTCKNLSCLNHGLEGAEGRIIRNQTAMNGCLEWRDAP